MSTAEIDPEALGVPQAALPASGELLTSTDVARLCKVTRDIVLHWIKSGSLAAINVAGNLGGRPRYRIEADDVHEFLSRRKLRPTVAIDAKAVERRRQVKKIVGESLEFFDSNGKRTAVK